MFDAQVVGYSAPRGRAALGSEEGGARREAVGRVLRSRTPIRGRVPRGKGVKYLHNHLNLSGWAQRPRAGLEM